MNDLTHLKGKFITLEGGEGTGKTTFTNMLFEDFKKQNISVIKAHDPGGTKLGNDIRKIILGKNSDVNDYAEMLLFSASRAQLTSEFILPALKKGKVVICDRWFDSTLVYQGICKNHDLSILKTIFEYTCNIIPDITFLLDVDAKVGLKRSYEILAKENVDESRFEDYGLVFHKKVNRAFLDLAYDDYYFPPNHNLTRIKIINANKDINYCYEKIKEHLENYKKK